VEGKLSGLAAGGFVGWMMDPRMRPSASRTRGRLGGEVRRRAEAGDIIAGDGWAGREAYERTRRPAVDRGGD